MPEDEGEPPQSEVPEALAAPPSPAPKTPEAPRSPAPEPPHAPPSPAPDVATGPAYLPFGAYAVPSSLVPSKPTWARTYELPSARQVVYAGLQLAQGSSRALRRASLYIGALALGAFGPAAILLLVGLGRLMSDPATAATLTSDNPFLLFAEQPGIGGPLALIYAVALIGGILLIAISIDAQAMAIALLGANAGERPIRLDEAVRRARQTFWRLFFCGLLVGFGSGVLTLVISWPFLRPFDTNQGVSFIASMIATLVFTPFAFASTGIVLGDASVFETLRRSTRLFRARPRIALVVTLFTLVTAAIQSFALGGGADLVFRVADFFHLGEGAASLILPGILVLAFIVAFGSLTFTIAAIVAAPQVAAFLGLTFYSGGLDLARSAAPAASGTTGAAVPAGATGAAGAPRRVRWVSIPMTIAMAGLAVVALVGLPTIVGFQPRPPSPVLGFMRDAVDARGIVIIPSGDRQAVTDPTADQRAPSLGEADILEADMSALDTIPAWMLDELFACSSPDVACGAARGAQSVPLDHGAMLFVQRMAGPPSRGGGGHAEWGQMVRVPNEVAAPAIAGDRYEGANVRFKTELEGDQLTLSEYGYSGGAWQEYSTTARSLWRGDLLVTLVPFDDIGDSPTAWDVYAWISRGGAVAYDNVRPADGEVIEVERLPWITVFDPQARR
jgi:hypothetical protein